MPDDFYPAFDPDRWWLVVGVALLIAAALWVGTVLWLTRRAAASPGVDAHPAPGEGLRSATLAEIDRLADARAAGTIDGRELAQALSPLVRRFLHAASGEPVHVIGLADVRRRSGAAHERLDAALTLLYPEEFAAAPAGASDDVLAAARRLVITAPVAAQDDDR